MNAGTLFATLFALAFVNVPGFIAEFNVSHAAQLTAGRGPPIDLDYLASLGPAALPALARLRPHVPADARTIDAAIAALRRDLADDLSTWQGWTYRRHRLARTLPPPLPAVTLSPTPHQQAHALTP
jgi:hypothetical protein